MGIIKAGSIDKGMFLMEKGDPYAVTEREFVNPGKGSSFVRLKLKNLRNGSSQKVTHKAQDSMEEIEVVDVPSQFLYGDEENFHFMDNDTFDQYEVSAAILGDKKFFLIEGEAYKVVKWDGETLDIKLPPKMDLIVAEAEDAVKGDTVTGATKFVVLETGLTVKVPIFIKQGERVRINVDTLEYQERINN